MNQKDMQAAFAAGEKDAQDAIDGKTSIDDLIHYHALKKQGNQAIKKHSYGTFIEAKRNGEFEEYDIMQDRFMRKYTKNFIQNWVKALKLHPIFRRVFQFKVYDRYIFHVSSSYFAKSFNEHIYTPHISWKYLNLNKDSIIFY